ncbi:hypothetical protein BCR44DRAFT_1174482 [Catenaria anguillulae PL171]|uniref:Uncharacterized protein n=1 Tax=Catenaria anguillulae PL171 TaxID=765915 RepID=A0A1Y2I098_9FUNG|nr:hypothetical protein BCR44DRAFT_1171750 [Catenaria anguillulae PL171]ORZ40435.1 hypothetical protein BCR44DRAFT_1174482 [Catenaria anguillulae PL171]
MPKASKRQQQVKMQQAMLRAGLVNSGTQYGNEDGKEYDLRALARVMVNASTQAGNEDGKEYDLRALAGVARRPRRPKASQPLPAKILLRKRPLTLAIESDDELDAATAPDPLGDPGPAKRRRPDQEKTRDENSMPAAIHSRAGIPASTRKRALPQTASQALSSLLFNPQANMQAAGSQHPANPKVSPLPPQATAIHPPDLSTPPPIPSPQQAPSPRLSADSNPKPTSKPKSTSAASQPTLSTCNCSTRQPARSETCAWCKGSGRIPNTSRVTESEKAELLKVAAAVRPYMPTSPKAAKKIKTTEVMRAVAVHLYIQFRLRGHGKDWSRHQASADAYFTPRRAGRIKKEYASFLATGKPIKFKSGGDRSKQSWLLTQEDNLQKMRDWLESQPRGKVTAAAFASWVTSDILKPLADAESATAAGASPKRNWAILTERLAKRYLRLLGWVYAKDAKGAYTDGKCRDDVLAERESFIAAMDALTPRMRTTVEELVHQDALQEALAVSGTSVVEKKGGQRETCGKDCESCGADGERKHVLVSRIHDPDLGDEERLVVPVYHDESTFMANDCQTVYWKPRWTHPLKKKSRGRGIMVSSFVCECHGELTVVVPIDARPPARATRRRDSVLELDGEEEDYGDEDESDQSDDEDEEDEDEGGEQTGGDSAGAQTNPATINGARVLFEYGARAQGYWTGTDLYHQVVDRLIPVFNAMHGDGPNGRPCQGLFVFDNATGHKIFAPDALVAKKLPGKDGGQNAPLMRATTFVAADGTTRVQSMQNDLGEPKGLKSILIDRDLWPKRGPKRGPDGKPVPVQCKQCKSKMLDDPGRSSRTDCCALRMVECLPDFVAQKCLIAEALEEAGHLVLFLPKFHPELNRALPA